MQDRLSGTVARPDGSVVADPEVRWVGRRHGRRKDRRWGQAWSPEQISHRLCLDFPDDESMRVSHEAIYQSLLIQGRGALRRELSACLRTGRALRVPRARAHSRGKGFITQEVMISQRPAEAEDRAVPGHWEGDLILGLGSSAIGTLVERSSRFTMLLHLPPMARQGPRVPDGPALAGHGAEAVRDAIATLPEQLQRSLTWDQGTEMAQHAQLRVQAGLPIYFCDPRSPWQRGSNENTNGLLRQYLPKQAVAKLFFGFRSGSTGVKSVAPPSRRPSERRRRARISDANRLRSFATACKGTDLARHDAADLAAVAAALNSRPRKTLGWRTPAEALSEYLSTTN